MSNTFNWSRHLETHSVTQCQRMTYLHSHSFVIAAALDKGAPVAKKKKKKKKKN